MRRYFHVPFSDNHRAREAGLKFDGSHKIHYTDNTETAHTAKTFWMEVSNPEPTTELIGEDRDFEGNTLFVDILPMRCWFVNAKHLIVPADWKRLSKGLRERCNFRCECCGKKETLRENFGALEVHERWDYDETTQRQTLKRLISLCHMCHRTTHWGYATLNNEEADVRTHFRSVNQVDDAVVDRHVKDAYALWNDRNAIEWMIDYTILTQTGVRLKGPQ